MPYLFTKFVKVHNFRLYSNLSFLDIFLIDSYLDNQKPHVYVAVTLLDLCFLIYWKEVVSQNFSLHLPDLQKGRAQRSIVFCKTYFRSSITIRELSVIIGDLVAISCGVETVVAIFTCVEILKDKILKASLRFLDISLCFDVRGSSWWLLNIDSGFKTVESCDVSITMLHLRPL